jgi:alkanesulfonate monooxygenase SsuD/methylene tetrahydromethanopterin reductase-like flavin-dependent oxidoreductase (luciferase family)
VLDRLVQKVPRLVLPLPGFRVARDVAGVQDPGRRNQDVEPPEGVDSRRRKSLTLPLTRNVALHRKRFAAEPLHGRERIPHPLAPEVGNHDVGALLGEAEGGRPANAACTPGYDCDLSLEPSAHGIDLLGADDAASIPGGRAVQYAYPNRLSTARIDISGALYYSFAQGGQPKGCTPEARMHLAYFTEEPLHTYPVDEARKRGDGVNALLFSNRWFDAEDAARLYAERLAELQLAERVGFDGVMLNEHHNTPFTMHPRINMSAMAAAVATERLKIILLGNPLPLCANPLQLAEELGMIDLVSKGRLVSGFVRGGGIEQLACNANPAYNRELFEEVHDILIKIWTEPGPFRWEGNHFQLRVVNPWTLPYQKPHPRIYIPGAGTPDTIVWAAQHRYPYVALATGEDKALRIWEIYDQAAREAGYEAGPPERGYLLRCHVAETEEKALENAREFYFMTTEFTATFNPDWVSPPGYDPVETRRQRLAAPPYPPPRYEDDMARGRLVTGNPQQVIEKLRWLMERLRPGTLVLWANDGRINHEDSKTCIRLLGEEVLPAVREYAGQLGLKDPFEADTPVSSAFMAREAAAV